MGAWGTGAFQNDDGLDWIGDFCDAPGEEALRAALDAVAGADGFSSLPMRPARSRPPRSWPR
jgi:hypothetical protein